MSVQIHPKLKATKRRCLRCKVEFDSRGPENRICHGCNRQIAAMGPTSPATFVYRSRTNAKGGAP